MNYTGVFFDSIGVKHIFSNSYRRALLYDITVKLLLQVLNYIKSAIWSTEYEWFGKVFEPLSGLDEFPIV